MEKLVSIVLPVYNGEKYLRESIDSIVAQTYKNWELIIVDDCSIDASAQISKEYASRDQRVRYYRNPQNLKLPRNLNHGFSLTNGEYLTWTSDDNLYKPDAIEKMVHALEDNNCHFTFASCRVIDEAGKEIEYMMVNRNSPKLIVGHDVVGACFLYSRTLYEAIGEYNPDCELVEDFDYWQRALSVFKAVPIEEILYYYRWHDGALTSTMNKQRFNMNLERILLKNRPLFGRLDIQQNLAYYSTLSRCRMGRDNPYLMKNNWYSWLYLIRYRIPRKIKRVLQIQG